MDKNKIEYLESENLSLKVELDKINQSKTYKILKIYMYLADSFKNLLKKVIPIWLRKKIKSKIISFFIKTPKLITPSEIKSDFDKYLESRSKSSFDIINFSVISWNYRIQRPQHLLKELSSNNRVFYIENEFIVWNGVASKAPFKISKISNNIYTVTLSASTNLFIYKDKPSTNDINIITGSLFNLFKEAKILNPISKIDHPFWVQICDSIATPFIYDCMDNHSGFSDNSSFIHTLEKKLFQNSDSTIVTSKYLFKIANQNHAKNITLIPNAGEYKHFSKLDKLYAPIDIKSIPHPIIGYYGAIADWFDTEILENIAKNHPDKSVVLIGLVSNPTVEKLASKYKNIYLLGEKTYQELPPYLKEFDVCLIPFILNDLIKATHPVKIFEYFAAGKPVVSTKLPEIIDNKLVYFANSKNFSKQINFALKNKDKDISKRQKFASINTWGKRAKILSNLIQKIIFPKVSIIILSYNHPDLLKKTLDSVINRSFYPNLEIIVVDNASNKKTIDLLKKYKNIKLVLNKENYGFAKGNNLGLKIATGDYLILLNNDVIITPGWISRLLFHVQKPKVGLVGPVTNSIGNEAKIDIFYNPNNKNDLESASFEYVYSHFGQAIELTKIAAFCWIMSRNTYQKIGDLDERFGRGMFEDDDYCLRTLKLGKKIICSHDVFIHHFGGASFKQIHKSDYQKLFEINKEKFETKWNQKWIPHQYRREK